MYPTAFQRQKNQLLFSWYIRRMIKPNNREKKLVKGK